MSTYSFASVSQLLDFVNNQKRILMAINALKIVNATPQRAKSSTTTLAIATAWEHSWPSSKKGLLTP